MIQPGDILTFTDINKRRDGAGFTWFSTSDEQIARTDRNLSKRDLDDIFQILMFGDKRVSMICVPGSSNGHPWVSLKDYGRQLIDFYYEKDGGIRKGHLPLILDRWRSFKDNPDKFKVSQIHDVPSPSRSTIWVLLENTGQWKLPVLASCYCKAIPNDPKWLFCPTPPSIFLENNLCPACYCFENRSFPVKFTITIHSKTDDRTKHCELLFHAFLRPELWHYKFWKHAVGGTGTSDVNEKIRWGQIFKKQIPSAQVFAEHKCKEFLINDETQKARCDLCEQDQFSKIHLQTRPALTEYIESLVTFFETSMTKEIRWGKPLSEICLIDIAGREDFDSAYYRFFLLRGVCYDWDTQMPLVHVYPWTYYFRRTGLSMWSDIPTMNVGPEWQEGRIENVNRKS